MHGVFNDEADKDCGRDLVTAVELLHCYDCLPLACHKCAGLHVPSALFDSTYDSQDGSRVQELRKQCGPHIRWWASVCV